MGNLCTKINQNSLSTLLETSISNKKTKYKLTYNIDTDIINIAHNVQTYILISIKK